MSFNHQTGASRTTIEVAGIYTKINDGRWMSKEKGVPDGTVRLIAGTLHFSEWNDGSDSFYSGQARGTWWYPIGSKP